MAVSVFYTSISKNQYKDALGKIPGDLVTISGGNCAARVLLKTIPGDPSNGVYAEIPSVMEGRVTSFAMRLVTGSPVGTAMLTTVSPILDVIGAYLYVFLDDILPTTAGPAMYRKTNIQGAYYCTDKMNTPQKMYVMIAGGAGLDGVSADVSMVVDSH